MSETIERFTITGDVQGVFYRKWAQATAGSLGLRGLVRNVADGSVEAVMAGTDEQLDAFAKACRSGPPAADVERVERTPADGHGLPESGVEIGRDG